MGRVEAGASAKAKIELGQHLVAAATEDGLDQFQQIIKVQEKGQTVLVIELRPLPEARIKTEQEARDKATREQLERDRQWREVAAREKLDRLVWTDAATGLMWAKEDNGSDVDFQLATDYCRGLQLAGYGDWRLPMVDELHGIYSINANVPGKWGDGSSTTWHVKGLLQLSGMPWGGPQENSYGNAWVFYFMNGGQAFFPPGSSAGKRALCVRRSGD